MLPLVPCICHVCMRHMRPSWASRDALAHQAALRMKSCTGRGSARAHFVLVLLRRRQEKQVCVHPAVHGLHAFNPLGYLEILACPCICLRPYGKTLSPCAVSFDCACALLAGSYLLLHPSRYKTHKARKHKQLRAAAAPMTTGNAQASIMIMRTLQYVKRQEQLMWSCSLVGRRSTYVDAEVSCKSRRRAAARRPQKPPDIYQPT